MDRFERSKAFLALLLALTLTACGGSGGGDDGGNNGGGNTNRAPTAAAGADQTVDEFDAVTLDGSASNDPDGDSLTYSWTQTAGTTVTLSDRTVAMPTFDAPDVTAPNTPDTLTFELTVNDGTANSLANTVDITVNDAGLGINTPPTADAGPDQSVVELTAVTLDASGSSDPDIGVVLTYSWAQTAGPGVTLSDNSAIMPTFTAPNVAPGATETLTFEVTVDDGTDNATDTVNIDVSETLPVVNIAGILRFEHINPNANCNGLNLGNPEERPMRGVRVELLTSGGALLATTQSGEDGGYAFSGVDASQDIIIRAWADMQRSDTVTWDVQVRDNTDPGEPVLTDRAMHAVDFAMNSGTNNVTDADFVARAGTLGAGYETQRFAAPFAMLDYVRQAMDMVIAVDPTVTFPPLDIYWSVNNTLVTGSSNIDAGELTSTFYTNSGLYILGDAGTDGDDYDDHVMVHEWGHYFEDIFSRSDSMGGSHYIGEPLDPRLAFGEGFASALAAIALNEPVYCDTRVNPSGGFGIDWEFDSTPFTLIGWMNELDVGAFIYDLWDTNNDGGQDAGSIGFDPIYQTMIGPQSTTTPFTSVFTFADGMRPTLAGADQTFLDGQLARINVDSPGNDEWGNGQTTIPTSGTFPDGRDVLPIYTTLPTDGTVVNVCLNDDYFVYTLGSTDYELGPADSPNKFGLFHHFRVDIAATDAFTIVAQANPAPTATTGAGSTDPREDSDPDLFLHRSGEWFPRWTSTDDGEAVENFATPTLAAGSYILRLQEWRFVDDNAAAGFPTQVCFDVSMTP